MSLKDLPNELIAAICEIADKDALMALRLTEKGLSTSATKSFSDRFMTSFSVFLTTPCLTRLAEICEHPSFGPGVRKLYISSRRITPHHIGYLEGQRDYLIKWYKNRIEEIARAELALQRCRNRYREEEALKQEGGATKLLTRAFTALEAWRHDVELSIVHDIQDFGANFLGSDCFQIRGPNATAYCLTSTFQPCLEAIHVSNMQFRKLDVSVRERSQDRTEVDFNLMSFSKTDLKRFSMLRSIAFGLARLTSHETVLSVAAIVSQARQLEDLHLSHGDKFYIDDQETDRPPHTQFLLGDGALQSVNSDKIKSLSFNSMSFSTQCLLELLDRYRNTLETLQFALCALRDGSWLEVISYMRESLPLLSTLKIYALFDVNPPSDYSTAIAGSRQVSVQGKKKVQAVLRAIIQDPLDDLLDYSQ